MCDNGPAGQRQDVTLAQQIYALRLLLENQERSPRVYIARDWVRALRAALATLDDYTAMQTVAGAARRYRDAETDGTPRMWRGKALQDLANELDDALSGLASPDTALPAAQEKSDV